MCCEISTNHVNAILDSDALRRHYERCPCRHARAIPKKQRPGRRKHACDQCTKSKLVCDADYPCETCLFQGRECTREWQIARPDTGEINAMPCDEQDFGEASKSHTADSASGSKEVFNFLLKYTTPVTRSLSATLGIDHVTNPETGYPLLFRDEPTFCSGEYESSINSDLEYENTGDSLLVVQPFGQDPIVDQPYSLACFPVQTGVSMPLSFSSDYLLANGIIDDVIFFVTQHKRPSKTEIAPTAATSLYRLLLTSDLREYLMNYFTRWHRHSPTIHRPTFRVAIASPPLLLAILIIGALLRVDTGTRTLVEQVLELVEHYIFEHESFQALLSGESDQVSAQNGLSALQAAFCMIQVQMRSNFAVKRSSIRQDRFQQLILATRSFNARHMSSFDQITGFVMHDLTLLQTFGLMEAAKRLSYGVFNLEASFSIFHDTRPRFLLNDLQLGLSCSVAEYLTATPSIILHDPKPMKSKIQLRDISNMLFDEQINFNESESVYIDVLHLFVLILGSYPNPKHWPRD